MRDDWQKPPEGRSGLPDNISPVDGRFLTVKSAAASGQTNATVILNWASQLRRLLDQ